MRLLRKWNHMQRQFELLYFFPSRCSSDSDAIGITVCTKILWKCSISLVWEFRSYF